MKVLNDKIFIIEDFISDESAKLLANNFSVNLKPTDHPNILFGINVGDEFAKKISGQYKITEYNDNNKIAVDLFTSLCANMEKTVSNIFKKDLVLKTVFYNYMTPGAENSLHYDNKREEDRNDYSGLLYLTDDYSGGYLSFPAQGIKLLPKAGTFISFMGTEDIKHEVEKITHGNRVNIICFFIEKELNDYSK
jgi:hypothetical protein